MTLAKTKHSDRPITFRSFVTMIQPVLDECKSLKRRVHELEAAQSKTLADSYKGTFLAGTKYARGDLLTHGGSLFLCLRDTISKPETDDSWRLIVKRGVDAK